MKDKLIVTDKTIEKWSEGVSFAASVAEEVRDVYEIHISEGRLKWVEYSEVHHPSVPEEEWKKWVEGDDIEFSMLITKCCNKNPWIPPWAYKNAELDHINKRIIYPNKCWVCPGCGNQIKKLIK
jgi:hypothetical protein